MVIFIILADFSNFCTNAQNILNTNFESNSNILNFLIPFTYSEVFLTPKISRPFW
jgi:hypothetical protein